MNGKELIAEARKRYPYQSAELSGELPDGTYFGIDLSKEGDCCVKAIRHEDGSIEVIEVTHGHHP